MRETGVSTLDSDPVPGYERAMSLRPAALAFLRLGAALVFAALVAGAFELAVLQTPYSPLHLPLPASPFAEVRGAAVALALFTVPLAWLSPLLGGTREPWSLFALYASGSIVKLGALAFAAATGMLAVQLVDPRPGAVSVVLARLAGETILVIAYVDAVRRFAKRQRSHAE